MTPPSDPPPASEADYGAIEVPEGQLMANGVMQTFGRRPWTGEEDGVIRHWYASTKRGQRGKVCMEKLPRRTKEAVKSRARALGITGRKQFDRPLPWSFLEAT